MQLRRKEECRDTHIDGGYSKDFGDEIPPRATQNTETKPDAILKKPAVDTESTVSASPEEQGA